MKLLIDDAKAERLRKAADQGPFHCGGIADPQSSCPTTWIYGPAAPGMQSGRQIASKVPTDVAPLFEASADLLTDRRTLLAEIDRVKKAYYANENEISKTLSEAIGYREVDGLPTYGEHTSATLATEAATKIRTMLARIAELEKENTALHDDNELLRQTEATRPAMMKSEEMAKLTAKTAAILAQLEAKETERLELRIVQLEGECDRQRDWIAGQDLRSDFQNARQMREEIERLRAQLDAMRAATGDTHNG